MKIGYVHVSTDDQALVGGVATRPRVIPDFVTARGLPVEDKAELL